MSSRAKKTSAARPKSSSAPGRRRRPAGGEDQPASREGFAVTRDGSPIYYQVTGNAAAVRAGRPALVLCDGIGCDGYVWKYIREALAEDLAIVHWHYRGHGQTPPPRDARQVTMQDLADDLAAVLAAAGVPRGVIAGHSMGVQVALEFYRRHSEAVAGLILLCGAYGTPLRTFRRRGALETALPLLRFAVGSFPRLTKSIWRALVPTAATYDLATRLEINGDLIRKEDFFPYLEHISRIDLALFLSMLAAADRHTARELLDAVTVPTLIVAGDRDGFTPLTLSEEMHRRIRGSELLVVEGGSHTAPLERPALVTDRVSDFVHRLAAGARERAAGLDRPGTQPPPTP